MRVCNGKGVSRGSNGLHVYTDVCQLQSRPVGRAGVGQEERKPWLQTDGAAEMSPLGEQGDNH